jgi:hypothetical protein
MLVVGALCALAWFVVTSEALRVAMFVVAHLWFIAALIVKKMEELSK